MATKGKIVLEFDLDKTNTTLTQFKSWDIAKLATWTHHPVWSNHQRDMTKGWQYAGTAEEFRSSWDWNQLDEPGTYALVLAPDGKCKSPIIDSRTFLFGETTVSVKKRASCSTGAIRGMITNQTTKWEGIHDAVCAEYNVAWVKPQDVMLFYRPHSVSDPKFTKSVIHSREMETQAHASWQVLHHRKTTCNTRDLPTPEHILKATAQLKKIRFNIGGI